MRSIAVFAAGILVLTVQTAGARCGFAPFRFNFGSNASTTGTCDAKGITGHLGAGGSSAFDSFTILEAPKHGRLEVRSRSTYGYLPAKGYAGPDHFALRVCGADHFGKGCSDLSYSFTVQ